MVKFFKFFIIVAVSVAAFFTSAYATNLRFGNTFVQLGTTKPTAPALAVSTATGTQYAGLTTDWITGPTVRVQVGAIKYSVISNCPVGYYNIGGTGACQPGGIFKVTLTGMITGMVFRFGMSATGNFNVDWGDGTAVQPISQTTTTMTVYTHTYANAGNYVVTFSGRATGYNPQDGITNEPLPAIYFGDFHGEIQNGQNPGALKITKVSGDMGSVFPILDASNSSGLPRFPYAFSGLAGLTEVSSDLFAGIQGAPSSAMFSWTFMNSTALTSIPGGLFASISGAPTVSLFSGTFNGCKNLTSIPSNLFSGISGAPAQSMFTSTFGNCTGLTGSIPANLFSGISGAPAANMFSNTFFGCTGLTGAIPSNLFSGISGAPAQYMFQGTFSGCTGLTSIGDGLFNGISGAAQNYMFGSTVANNGTFYNCTNLTGPSAKSDGQYLYQKWPTAVALQVGNAYTGATQLTDYPCIPDPWVPGGPTAGYSLDGSGVCGMFGPTTCPIGQGLNNNTGGSATVCSPCKIGYYSDDKGVACKSCDTVGTGYTTDTTGSTASSQCHAVQTIVAFTSAQNYTVPVGYTKIDVFAVGGGGGGHQDQGVACWSGGGGHGGSVVYSTITVTPGQVIKVTIGAGGAQNTAGGTTTFDSVTAAGGATGDVAQSANPGAPGVHSAGYAGAKGTAVPFTVGDANYDGKYFGAGGGGGSNTLSSPCTGYSSVQPAGGITGGGTGGGGGNGTPQNAGGNASFYGGGGGGGAFSSTHTYGTGGTGYQGIVIIRLHN